MGSDRVIGIDLGTVNSCVSYLDDDGVPRVIPDGEGRKTQPSVFAINNAEQPKRGYDALAQRETNPLNTIFAVKRLIGRRFSSSEVQEAVEKLPYKILESDNGDAWIQINSKAMSPEQVSAQVLMLMKEVAETYLGEEINKAVITVPAHFNDAQRQATKDAGEIAGLKVLNMINEPTAAALSYGLDVSEGSQSNEERLIAVFDLGGGTFDITILKMHNGRFEVLATNGDTYLGGEDFDLAIQNYFVEKFKSDYGVQITDDKRALQRLKVAAKEAKHILSEKPFTDVHIPYLSSHGGSPKDLKLRIDRKTLESSVGHLLAALDGPCLEAVHDAGINAEDIDDIVLVGGMTKMPLIQKRCKQIFGKAPLDSLNPDTAVADGAAIQAGIMRGLLDGLSFSDVTSLAFGIEVQGGLVATLLEKNTAIPCRQSERMTTTSPNQTEITIHIVQGDSPYVSENRSLGLFKLKDIPQAPRGAADIDVVLEVDEDGIIHASASDLNTGKHKTIDIMPTSGLSESELERLIEEEKTHKKEERRRAQRIVDAETKLRQKARNEDSPSAELQEVVELRNSLKCLIFATQFRLDTEGACYKGRARDELDKILQKARKILDEENDTEPILNIVGELENATDIFDEFLEEITYG